MIPKSHFLSWWAVWAVCTLFFVGCAGKHDEEIIATGPIQLSPQATVINLQPPRSGGRFEIGVCVKLAPGDRVRNQPVSLPLALLNPTGETVQLSATLTSFNDTKIVLENIGYVTNASGTFVCQTTEDTGQGPFKRVTIRSDKPLPIIDIRYVRQSSP
jgi:hypothetical protein